MKKEVTETFTDGIKLMWNSIRGLWIWTKIDMNEFLAKINVRSHKKYVHVLMKNFRVLIYDVWPKVGIEGENVEMVKKAYLDLSKKEP